VDLSPRETVSGTNKGSGYVTTWHRALVGTVNRAATVLESLDELMDIFLNAYLKANQDEK